LFPGALGDLLCCWPALDAWRRTGGAALTLVAQGAWFDALPRAAVTPLSIDSGAVADLFSTAPLRAATRQLLHGYARVVSWTGHGDRNFAARLATATGAAVAVHPFRALRAGEHAADYYARCLGVAAPASRLPIRPDAAHWAAALWRRHALGAHTLAVHPGSGSTRKNWDGMAAAAGAWRAAGGTVVAVHGPAESEREAIAADVALRDEPLRRVAAVLARAHRYLGNDSGISHLAGLVGARGVALFGGTDPRAWAPRGAGIRVLAAPDACAACGADRFCTHRLTVAQVLEQLTAS
jgi:hypothetical protein